MTLMRDITLCLGYGYSVQKEAVKTQFHLQEQKKIGFNGTW